MHIYAVRDRLLNYFKPPFVGPTDKQVLSGFAQVINSTEGHESDIIQAPHQFEIWRLGTVTEEGHIEVNKEFLADCSSLIRNDLRPVRGPGTTTPRTSEDPRGTAPSGAQADTGASPGPIQGQVQAAPGAPLPGYPNVG